jgi:hypothetical protein
VFHRKGKNQHERQHHSIPFLPGFFVFAGFRLSAISQRLFLRSGAILRARRADNSALNYTGLPTGSYTFYFGVGLIMNGLIDVGSLFYDNVKVNIVD